MRATFKVNVPIKGVSLDEVTIAYTKSDGANCGWSFKVGEEATVVATGTLASGFRTSRCMMIPYASAAARGSDRFEIALAEYRDRRNALAVGLKQNPSDVPLLRQQAQFFVRYRDNDDADEAFSRVLAILPTDVLALVGRGQVRYDSARYEHALADFRAALKLQEGNTVARKWQALSLVKLGRVNELTSGDRDFSGFDSGYTQRVSFAGVNLAGAIFTDSKLNGVDFSGADLRNSDFSRANMHSANFTAAKLTGAKFAGVKSAYNTAFHKADLRGATFAGAYLFTATFDGALLENADFSSARMEKVSLENAVIANANFRGANLVLARLRGTVWESRDLTNVDLRGSDLREAVFRNSKMSGVRIGFMPGSPEMTDLRGTDLSDVDVAAVAWEAALIDCRTKFAAHVDISALPLLPLWGTCSGTPPRTSLRGGYARQAGPRLVKIEATGASLSGLDLSGFGFWSVRFDNADFSGSILANIDIQGGSYSNTNFSRAQLKAGSMRNVSFPGASFVGANFADARLHGVDLSGARLEGAKLTGACFDATTRWPPGFDPVAAGAKGACW